MVPGDRRENAFPSPLWGGARGGDCRSWSVLSPKGTGVATVRRRCRLRPATPTPNPSPQGGGEHAPLSCYGALELAEHRVPTLHGGVERRLRRLLPVQRRLDLLRPDVADLGQVAEPQAPRVLRRLLVGELLYRHLEDRVLLVEA